MTVVSYTTPESPNVAGFDFVIHTDEKGNKQHGKYSKKLKKIVLHREDGPAIEYVNGYKAHYINGLKHGTVEFAGKVCSTWNKGVRVS